MNIKYIIPEEDLEWLELKGKRQSPRRKSKSETVEGQKKYHRGGQVKGYTFGEALHSKSWP